MSMTSKTTNKFSPEVRERAVRLVLETEAQHPSRWQAVMSIAAKIGCTPQTLNEWVKKAGIPTEMAERLKALERENRELRQANEILRKASAYFAALAELDRRSKSWSPSSTTIEGNIGVEPICDVLPIAPSTYLRSPRQAGRSGRRSDRAKRDDELRPEIQRVFEDNWSVYGVRKVWHQLRREGFDVARCTVARLMKDMGIQGIIRGKPHRTTIPTRSSPARWTR
jgi:transposase-like protein